MEIHTSKFSSHYDSMIDFWKNIQKEKNCGPTHKNNFFNKV